MAIPRWVPTVVPKIRNPYVKHNNNTSATNPKGGMLATENRNANGTMAATVVHQQEHQQNVSSKIHNLYAKMQTVGGVIIVRQTGRT